MLFRAGKTPYEVEVSNNQCQLKLKDEVKTLSGWKYASDLQIGDVLTDDSEFASIESITVLDDVVNLMLKEVVA